MRPRPDRSRRIPFAALGVLAGVLAFGGPGPVTAAFVDAFSGNLDLAKVSSKIDGRPRDSFRQDYTANFNHSFTSYLDIRAGVRYYKFDQELDAVLGSYQEEWQPSGNLRWNHPLFTFTSTLRHRAVRGINTNGWITTDDLQFLAQTKDLNYPIVSLSYDQQEINSVDAGLDRHIRNDRFRATVSKQIKKHDFNYNFSHILAENVVTSLDSKSTFHTLRWSGSGDPGSTRQWDLSGNYVFNYGRVETEVRSGTAVLQIISPFRGLYAFDDAPDFGALEPKPGLIDGNTELPTVPPIDIGGTINFQNVGVDLGSARDIAGLYIYTDRPSEPALAWEIHVSDDNRTWELWDATPRRLFNAALNRYELLFNPASYRYVKAVNKGLNSVVQVYVTEVQALEELLPTDDQVRYTASHNLGGRAAYTFSRAWSTALESNLRHEKTQGLDNARQDVSLAWRLRYQPSHVYSHQFRWEQGFYSMAGRPDTRSDVAAYSLVMTPMDVMRGAISASNRRAYEDNDRERNTFNVAFQGNGTPYHGLDLEVGTGWSRILDFRYDDDYETWVSRLGFDAEMTSYLTLLQDNTYQETRTDAGEFRVSATHSIGLDWRLTTDIYARSSLRYIRQVQNTVTGDFMLGWNVSQKLRLSASYYGIRYNDITTSERWSLNGNLEVSRRGHAYARLSEIDLSGGGGSLTKTWQIGFRWGF